MTKIFTTLVLAFGLTSALHAQEYNMFNLADVDENGWLWFDTQAKIDKYVGRINEDDNKANLNGKLIQMVAANQSPDYPETTVSPDYIGIGKDGKKGTEMSRKGAIMLQPGNGDLKSMNGGGIVICMPSCTTFGLAVSCEKIVSAQLLSTKNANAELSQYEVRGAYTVFNRFASAGYKVVNGLENVNRGSTSGTIKSDGPVYALFINGTRDTLYIHGIKVTTPRQESTGIRETAVQTAADVDVYAADGSYLGRYANEADLKALRKGVYIIRKGKQVKKVVTE
jgi:hypothetical protein